MSTLKLTLLVAVLGTAATAWAAPQIMTDPLDMPDEMMAKMARYRAKFDAQKHRRDPQAGGPLSDPAGCGGVDIGNVNSGGGMRGPRENVVIITGDVINAYNDCK